MICHYPHNLSPAIENRLAAALIDQTGRLRDLGGGVETRRVRPWGVRQGDESRAVRAGGETVRGH